MSSSKIHFSLWSNNDNLLEDLINRNFPDLQFNNYKSLLHEDYLVVIIDLSKDFHQKTQILSEMYLNAREKQKKLLFVLILGLNTDTEKISYFQKFLLDISPGQPIHRLIICQDLYTLNLSHSITDLDNFITTAINKKTITVSSKGELFFYPLSLNDLISLIKRTLFLSSTTGQEYYLQGERLSDLNLAYLLQKSLSEQSQIEIDINNSAQKAYSKQNFQQNSIGTLAQLNWEPTEIFEADLKNYLKNQKSELRLEITNQKKPHFWLQSSLKKLQDYQESLNLKSFITLKIKYFIEGVAALICLIYLFSSLVFIVSAYYSLNSLEKSFFFLKKGDIHQSTTNLNKSVVYKDISETNYSLVSPVIRFFSSDFNNTNLNFLAFLNFAQSTFQNLNQTYGLVETVYNSINNPNNHQNYEDLSLALKSNLQQSFESLSQIEIILNKEELPLPLIQKIKQNIEYKQLQEAQSQIGSFIKTVDILPSLLGNKRLSQTIILFQNNEEQRATGGVIENLIQIGFDQGKVVFYKTYTPQDIDSLDSFTLTPPPFVEKVLGSPVWKLKDMNYNPDFPQTATNIAWYLEKKLKIKPDLIISLNSSALSSLGQGTKLEKLQSLIDQSLKHQLSVSELGKTIIPFFQQDNLYLWSSDENTERLILNQPYAGSVRSYECHPAISSSRVCLAHTTFLNFSNYSLLPLGGNLQKKIIHTVTPQVLSVENQILVEYSYTKPISLINRNLIEVVQLYLPKTSIISTILLNGEKYPVSNLLAQEESTLTRYQFILSTKLNEKQTLQINYDIPLSEKTTLPAAYSLTDLKQSGSLGTTSTLEINIPEQSRASAITAEVLSKPNKIIYTQNSKTSTFGVNFVPKLQ